MIKTAKKAIAEGIQKLTRGRIRVTGSGGRAHPVPPDGPGELYEVWEGGELVGYERTKPKKKWLAGY